MPLQVVCPSCNAKLKAPDTAAGKKTKCPKCQGVISVPADAPQAPAVSPGMGKKLEKWHMQTTDGSQFGPVPRSELDEWFKEGRISADCQLLKDGADQWQWASEIYPSLEQSAPAPAPSKPTDGFDFLGPSTPANNDPLGLGNTGLSLAPMQPASPSYQAPAYPTYQAPAYPTYQAPAYPASAPSYGAANPYSSPAPVYGGYNQGYGGGGGHRSGLPWDVRDQSFGTWWETLTTILGGANDAFRRMHISGGLGRPIMYAMFGIGIGQIGPLLLQLGLLSIAAAGGAPLEAVALQMGYQVVTAIIGTVFSATIGLFIGAAILHVCLMMVGGEKNGYEATFRVLAYSAGTFGPFQIIPVLGPCVAVIWQIIVTIIGLAEAHETTGGKAALAYFIPLIACFGCILVMIFLFGAMVFAALQGAAAGAQ